MIFQNDNPRGSDRSRGVAASRGGRPELSNLEFRACGTCRAWCLESKVQGLGFRVQAARPEHKEYVAVPVVGFGVMRLGIDVILV